MLFCQQEYYASQRLLCAATIFAIQSLSFCVSVSVLLALLSCCYGQRLEYDRCSHGLTSVPTDIPTSATSVGLCNNAITTIPELAFPGLGVSTHVTIHLDHNLISYIHPDAFLNVPKLKSVRLSSNKLTEVPNFPPFVRGVTLCDNELKHFVF